MALNINEGMQSHVVGNLRYDSNTRKWVREERTFTDKSDGTPRESVSDPNTAYLEYIAQMMEELLETIKCMV